MRWNRNDKSKDLPFGWILIAVTVMSAAAIKYYLYPPAAPEPQEQTVSSNWQKIASDMAVVNSPTTFQPRDKTFVTIPIKFSSTPAIATLSFESSSSAKPNTILIHHQLLDDLDWKYKEDGDLRIFYRTKEMASLGKLLSQSVSNRIWITSEIKNLPQLALISNHVLDLSTNMDKVDYIVTTYQPLKKLDDGFVFMRLIDASDAKVSDNNKISWIIKVDKTSKSNPFFIGSVHVDYRY